MDTQYLLLVWFCCLTPFLPEICCRNKDENKVVNTVRRTAADEAKVVSDFLASRESDFSFETFQVPRQQWMLQGYHLDDDTLQATKHIRICQREGLWEKLTSAVVAKVLPALINLGCLLVIIWIFKLQLAPTAKESENSLALSENGNPTHMPRTPSDKPAGLNQTAVRRSGHSSHQRCRRAASTALGLTCPESHAVHEARREMPCSVPSFGFCDTSKDYSLNSAFLETTHSFSKIPKGVHSFNSISSNDGHATAQHKNATPEGSRLRLRHEVNTVMVTSTPGTYGPGKENLQSKLSNKVSSGRSEQNQITNQTYKSSVGAISKTKANCRSIAPPLGVTELNHATKPTVPRLFRASKETTDCRRPCNGCALPYPSSKSEHDRRKLAVDLSDTFLVKKPTDVRYASDSQNTPFPEDISTHVKQPNVHRLNVGVIGDSVKDFGCGTKPNVGDLASTCYKGDAQGTTTPLPQRYGIFGDVPSNAHENYDLCSESYQRKENPMQHPAIKEETREHTHGILKPFGSPQLSDKKALTVNPDRDSSLNTEGGNVSLNSTGSNSHIAKFQDFCLRLLNSSSPVESDDTDLVNPDITSTASLDHSRQVEAFSLLQEEQCDSECPSEGFIHSGTLMQDDDGLSERHSPVPPPLQSVSTRYLSDPEGKLEGVPAFYNMLSSSCVQLEQITQGCNPSISTESSPDQCAMAEDQSLGLRLALGENENCDDQMTHSNPKNPNPSPADSTSSSTSTNNAGCFINQEDQQLSGRRSARSKGPTKLAEIPMDMDFVNMSCSTGRLVPVKDFIKVLETCCLGVEEIKSIVDQQYVIAREKCCLDWIEAIRTRGKRILPKWWLHRYMRVEGLESNKCRKRREWLERKQAQVIEEKRLREKKDVFFLGCRSDIGSYVDEPSGPEQILFRYAEDGTPTFTVEDYFSAVSQVGEVRPLTAKEKSTLNEGQASRWESPSLPTPTGCSRSQVQGGDPNSAAGEPREQLGNLKDVPQKNPDPFPNDRAAEDGSGDSLCES